MPSLCQSRTRERLVALLNSLGQHVGLPKSPSVIFSQNDLLNSFYFSPLHQEQLIDEVNLIDNLNEESRDDDNDVLPNNINQIDKNNLTKCENINSTNIVEVLPISNRLSNLKSSQSILDDNNFINNTFSFLDDLETQNY